MSSCEIASSTVFPIKLISVLIFIDLFILILPVEPRVKPGALIGSSIISRSRILTLEFSIPIFTVRLPAALGNEVTVPLRFMLKTFTPVPSLKSEGL